MYVFRVGATGTQYSVKTTHEHGISMYQYKHSNLYSCIHPPESHCYKHTEEAPHLAGTTYLDHTVANNQVQQLVRE